MKQIRAIRCGTHGVKPWTGQVICTHCGAVWHLNHENPHPKDGTCTCGKELSGKDGTARAICPGCYTLKKAQAAAGPS